MKTDTRTPEEIERDIERERAGLTNTIEDLQDKFSVETLARQFTDHLRENGSDIGRSVSQSVKDNPMAVALTGIGLAWMIFGGGSASQRRSYERRDDRHDDYDGRYRFASDRRDRSALDYDRNDHRSDRNTEPAWLRSGGETTYGTTRTSSDLGDDNSGSDGGSLGDTAKSAGKTVKETVQSVSSAAQSAKEGVSDAADRTTAQAAALRDRLSEGTEKFSEEARNRVVTARQHAWDSYQATQRHARTGQRRAAELYDDQPLIGGALAFAVGAAVAAALPRTQMEDDYLGEQSDAAIAEAERVFQQEKSKLTEVAKAAGEEVKKAAKDVKDTADSKASSRTAAKSAAKTVKKAGERVTKAAKDEAKKQDLGKPKS
ncbi:DUF3618 domain-containing protein [Rhodophyticola sp.]|jgi:translation initiation factor 2B subunit (eIF-2B alpha/beta/delta family)|uniref:DUF3618 domain-containing protein n=1 Tax=Rhodophyticola sp. TaxID=2680032 RepID=UPI003D2730F7